MNSPFAGHTFSADRDRVFVDGKSRTDKDGRTSHGLNFILCRVDANMCDRNEIAKAIADALNRAAEVPTTPSTPTES